MILKNLFRRKARTFLTVLGIAIGVASIISLGAIANSLDSGYSTMLTGSQADMILSQPNTLDIAYSAVDESLGAELEAMPEVTAVSGMLQGFVQTPGSPYFFVFGYGADSFVLERFEIVEGVGLGDPEAQRLRGKPVLLGKVAAETLDKRAGDTLRVAGSAYRIAGVYETGDAFEDAGAVFELEEAQELLGKPRQVSLFYIQLKDLALRERLQERVERRWDDLEVSSTSEYADKQLLGDYMNAFVWVIAGMAIVLGGVGMMNAQLMAVYERTREIGVLRAVGWSSRRVLWLILWESVAVCLAGGLVGIALGWAAVYFTASGTLMFGSGTGSITPGLVAQALSVVLVLGLAGGLYPAVRAARMQPIEALRYEGGSTGQRVHRLPAGGMALQSLWQRSTRTLLTLVVISMTVGSIMAMDGVVSGALDEFAVLLVGGDAEVVVREADIADTTLSAVDEHVGDKIAAMPGVAHVSGMLFTAVMLPENQGFFILQGYSPAEAAIRRFNVVEGEPITSNHQIILGRTIAESLKKKPGDTIDLSGTRYRVTGIYETSVSWEGLGGVVTLRDAQTFIGKPRKVTIYMVKLHDSKQAEAVVDKINSEFEGIHAAVSGEFINQLPDMQVSEAMMNSISLLAIIVGGVGVMNTMLMAVYERTREIGVLRALGWRRRAVLGMILRESLTLALLGGVAGIGVAFAQFWLFNLAPSITGLLDPNWSAAVFARAMLVAVLLGLVGGLYPAYRATRLQPIEALRYE